MTRQSSKREAEATVKDAAAGSSKKARLSITTSNDDETPASPVSERTVTDGDVNSQRGSADVEPEMLNANTPTIIEPEIATPAGTAVAVDPHVTVPHATVPIVDAIATVTPTALVPTLPNTEVDCETLVPTVPNTEATPTALVPTLPNSAAPLAKSVPAVVTDDAPNDVGDVTETKPARPRATASSANQHIAPTVKKGANYDTTMNDFEDPESLFRRVLSMVTGAWPQRRVYAIGQLPAGVTWGRAEQYDSTKERTLCDADSNQPYQIWIVGRVSKTWFIENGSPAKICNLGIIPLDNDDFMSAQRKIASLSNPVDGATQPVALQTSMNEAWGTVYAKRFGSAYSSEGLSEPKLFCDCFDGTEVVRHKSEMTQYPVTGLRARDLVCMEVNVVRYKTGKKGPKWINWQAQYSLQAIYLLAKSLYVAPKENFATDTQIYV